MPVVVRNGAVVIEALAAAMRLFPFPLRGVDFDNDGAFMNEPVVEWCRARGLKVTRSRAYRKNDQAHVEQKNGAIVRRLVGYGRLEGLVSTASQRRDAVRVMMQKVRRLEILMRAWACSLVEDQGPRLFAGRGTA